MLLTELGWENIPKNDEEQKMRDLPRGHVYESHPLRRRYEQVRSANEPER